MSEVTDRRDSLDGADADAVTAEARDVAGRRRGPRPVTAVLAGISVADLDLDRIRHLVEVRSRRRLRRRRGLLGGAAVLVAITAAALVWPSPEPQEISADRDQDTSTSSTASTTSEPVAVTTVPVTTVSTVSTSTTAAVTTVVPTIATTTTVAPNKPMTVQAELLDGTTMAPAAKPVAGRTVVLRVRWSDPDLSDPAVVDVNAEFGDPLLAMPIAAEPRPSCDRAGGGSSALVDIPFRYSSVGTPTIQVEVTACDGAGLYGERVVQSLPIKVEAPEAGTRLVVLAGVEGGRSPDAGEVVAGSAVSGRRTPELPLVLKSDGAPATVAPIPATHAGGVLLRWQPTVCQPSMSPAIVEPGNTTLRVLLGPTTSSCSASP